MYTLDTNAVIYYTAGDPTTVSVLEEIFGRPNPIYLSAISEIELFGYPSLGPEEAGKIGKFLEGVSLIALDSRIARIAAESPPRVQSRACRQRDCGHSPIYGQHTLDPERS